MTDYLRQKMYQNPPSSKSAAKAKIENPFDKKDLIHTSF